MTSKADPISQLYGARLGEQLDAALQGVSGAEVTDGAVKRTADQE